MSDSESTSNVSQHPVKIQSDSLTGSSDALPGFALPEAALHSIPLPAEFNALVLAATQENRVETILPKFFNPLFRRQGVVNKHTLGALESVGQSLAQLAQEIEGRDRVLELLTAHLNSYGEQVHRRQLGLAHFSDQLAQHVSEATSNLNARLDQGTKDSRLRTDILVASARSVEFRLSEFRTLTAAINRQLEELQGSSKQNQLAFQEQTARLTETNLQANAQFADLRVQTAALQSAAGASQQRLDQLQALAVAANASAHAAAEQVRAEISDALTSLVESTDKKLAELGQQNTTLQSTTLATESRLAEVHALAAAARASARAAAEQVRMELEVVLTNLSQRTDAQFAEQREALVRDQVGPQTELNKRIGTLESSLQQIATGLEARLARLEARQETLESAVKTTTGETEARWASASKREDALVSSTRAAGEGLENLTSDLESMRKDLCALAELGAAASKRQESAEAALGGTNTALETLLPSLQAQLERLAGMGPSVRRRTAADEALKTIAAAQTAKSDGFYVALEARFRGPRTLIRERQSKYLPTIAEARRRVELFPPSSTDLPEAHPLSRLNVEGGVLDLGCGRGEWLDLLKEQGVPVLGVDQNQFFLQVCRQRSCPVADADLMEFLRAAPDASVAVVTGFHVIEHLPIPVLQDMLVHVFRVLRRGGAAIFETPNPGNILTSSLNFLLDPTHVRPVHPEFARLLMETSGFSSVRLEYMSPNDPSNHVGDPDDPLACRFNDYFYGPQDYAVVGLKP